MENKISVLLADNSETFGLSCAAAMRAESLDVQTINKDGRHIVDTVSRLHPDVVMMDFFLPGMDALGVIKGIQELHLSRMPLILVMSNTDKPALEQAALEGGADYYLLKPFDVPELSRRIRSLRGQCHLQALRGGKAPGGSSLEIHVTEILHQIGVPAHIKGYPYVRDAILLSIEDEEMINAVTKRLYPAVAKRHDTTSSRVERAIRHAIEVAWDRGDVEVLNSYFGYTIHNERGKPTNSEFIAMISDKFRLQLKIG